ncbi:hypothetical protein [Limibacterium fermenti]|uniref:hypothetical protein n=1 Tax=Limibacterium fermenti TaxID=3229863 RepID=UPI000E89D827|nr:hypothetical protein [Porphyromonadaceae bacterium]
MEELRGQATAGQIEEWKKKQGDIFKVEVGDSVCYLKKPDRKTMSYVATLGNNPIRANEALLQNCWLGGDESIKTDDEKFFGVSAKLAEIVQIKEAEITKL